MRSKYMGTLLVWALFVSFYTTPAFGIGKWLSDTCKYVTGWGWYSDETAESESRYYPLPEFITRMKLQLPEFDPTDSSTKAAIGVLAGFHPQFGPPKVEAESAKVQMWEGLLAITEASFDEYLSQFMINGENDSRVEPKDIQFYAQWLTAYGTYLHELGLTSQSEVLFEYAYAVGLTDFELLDRIPHDYIRLLYIKGMPGWEQVLGNVEADGNDRISAYLIELRTEYQRLRQRVDEIRDEYKGDWNAYYEWRVQQPGGERFKQ